MRAEVVAVGSELLLGDAVDTNSARISARLAEIGVDVHRHTTVGDNVERMADVIGGACARADAVIVTGGLGPTADDLTRVAVAQVAGVELERRHDLAEYLHEYFASAGREMPESNLVQADLPRGAQVLHPVGTAAGFTVAVGASTVWCVPGVPREMEAMFERDVLPALRTAAGTATTVSRMVRTAGMAESAVGEVCAPLVERLAAAGNPTLAFLASRGETRVRLTAKAATRQEALALLEPLVAEVVGLLGVNVAGVDDEGVEWAIARQLTDLGLLLGVAESVTGGGVSARLVSVPGASSWLRGSLVTYSTDVKSSLAGVDPALLDEAGPVSEETAAALARGARERLGADVGLAVVGVAGPTTQSRRPVGFTCVGAALPDGSVTTAARRLPARGRTDVQEFAASMALDFLRRVLGRLG
ncbi:MAG: competence/damage-inducible protein A [Nitriliruptorales bacterium]|nr:competence/damage-inducible protein A [Nitriliruptorales bacterium]